MESMTLIRNEQAIDEDILFDPELFTPDFHKTPKPANVVMQGLKSFYRTVSRNGRHAEAKPPMKKNNPR